MWACESHTISLLSTLKYDWNSDFHLFTRLSFFGKDSAAIL